MYRHILALVDCTEEARRAADQIARHFAFVPACRVTLAATVSASPAPEIRAKRVQHARGALEAIGDILLNHGIYTTRRVLEGSDPAAALAEESRAPAQVYDLIV
jgi:hypothetical protein